MQILMGGKKMQLNSLLVFMSSSYTDLNEKNYWSTFVPKCEDITNSKLYDKLPI